MGHAITPSASRGLPKAVTSAPKAPVNAKTQRRKHRIGDPPTSPLSCLIELALQIADSTARSDIECYCLPAQINGQEWYDTDQAPEAGAHASDRDFIDLAVAYLDARGECADYRTIRCQASVNLIRFEAKP